MVAFPAFCVPAGQAAAPIGGRCRRGDRRAAPRPQEKHPEPAARRGRGPAQWAGRDAGRGGGGGPPRHTEARPHPGQPRPNNNTFFVQYSLLNKKAVLLDRGGQTGRSQRAPPGEAARGPGTGDAQRGRGPGSGPETPRPGRPTGGVIAHGIFHRWCDYI